ncbi:MAG: hypothetical protein P8X79_06165 [Reinekea sp.]
MASRIQVLTNDFNHNDKQLNTVVQLLRITNSGHLTKLGEGRNRNTQLLPIAHSGRH